MFLIYFPALKIKLKSLPSSSPSTAVSPQLADNDRQSTAVWQPQPLRATFFLTKVIIQIFNNNIIIIIT